MLKLIANFAVAGLLGFAFNTTVNATVIDWTTTTLSGDYPNFTFSHSTLGTVSLTYSDDVEYYGIDNLLGGDETLLLGNTGGESLTISWTNSITNLDLEIWDIDATPGSDGEAVTFSTSADVAPVLLHSTDVWNSLTNTLSSDGTPNDNSNVNNYTVMGFVNLAGFNSITFDWEVDGTGILGIGDTALQSVPEPATLALMGLGLAGIGFARKKKA